MNSPLTHQKRQASVNILNTPQIISRRNPLTYGNEDDRQVDLDDFSS